VISFNIDVKHIGTAALIAEVAKDEAGARALRAIFDAGVDAGQQYQALRFRGCMPMAAADFQDQFNGAVKGLMGRALDGLRRGVK
jgi:hypothetical protein